MLTAPPTTVADVDPLLRPRQVIARLDAATNAETQRAASEGRLEPAAVYSAEQPTTRASLIQVSSGVLGFAAALIAVPLVLMNAVARAHGAYTQAEGGMFAALVFVNIVAGFAAVAAHDALHALAVRLLGGQATLVATSPFTFAWSAPAQGFGRRSLLFVVLFPFLALTLLWVILLIAYPPAAALTVAGIVASTATAGIDLWVVRALSRAPAGHAVFVAQPDGYIAYAVTATKPVRKKPIPAKGKAGK